MLDDVDLMQMVFLTLSRAPFYDHLTFTLPFIARSLLSLSRDSMMSCLSASPIPWDHNQSAKVLSPH